MKVRFEVKAHIETEEGLTDEQRLALLDEIIGGLPPVEIAAWFKTSRYAEALQTAMQTFNDGE